MDATSFRADFLWGVASSGHQTEGHNVASDTWFLERVTPTVFAEPSGHACNSWELWERDLDLAAEMGLSAFRFSIEWSRVEPERGRIDGAALAHYGAIIDGCSQRGMKAVATYNHFTCPDWFARRGGWLAPDASDRFAEHCGLLTREFGSRLAAVITLNEPNLSPLLDWAGLPAFVHDLERATLAAASESAGVARYRAGNVILPEEYEQVCAAFTRAHVAAKKAIKAVRPELPVGLSIAISDDVAAPGGEAVVALKRREVYEHWLDLARDDDFIGVQNYERAVYGTDGLIPPAPGSTLNQMGTAVEPTSLAGAVRYAYDRSQVPVLITEHGIGVGDDGIRARFIPEALEALSDVVRSGVPVLGYFHWTLLDNFEWIFGYSRRFGLHAVDRDTLVRTPKPSSSSYAAAVRFHRRSEDALT
ncbi:glycoside hydrolase family 1 protein [Microbacterium sp. NPDC088619]|uniref:glycoside hydrolase family 1 protein n=1 Tax=Microbacterium sp. NPDC088619 TaxID=3364196 RepID=UPI003821DBE2